MTTLLRLASIAILGALSACVSPSEAPSGSSSVDALEADATYTNPELGTGADPGVIRVGSKYLLVRTSGGSPDAIPVRESTDLVHYADVGAVFPRGQWPGWVKGDFWAPELHRVGDRHAVFFTARSKANDRPSVGVAWTSDLDAWGRGELAWSDVHWQSALTPLATDDRVLDPAKEDRAGLIDPTYLAFGGKHYVYFNRDLWTNKPDGVWRHQGEIYAQELDVGGPSYVAMKADAPRKTVLKIDRSWEGDVLEGANLFVRDGKVYLLYSANRYWEGKYCVGVATSTTPMGTFTKQPEPILKSNSAFVGPGHGTFITTEKGDDYFVYHAYRAGKVGDDFQRLLMLDRVSWTSGFPVVNGSGDEPGTPSRTALPLPR